MLVWFVVLVMVSSLVELGPPAPASAAPDRGPDATLPGVPEENGAAKDKAAQEGTAAPALDAGGKQPGPQAPDHQGAVDVPGPPAGGPQPAKVVDGPTEAARAQLPTGGEVESLRTETSRTYQNEDGTFRTEVGTAPVNMRMPDGRLEPIDPALEPVPAPASASAPAAGARGASNRPTRLRSRRTPASVEIASDGSDPSLASVDLGPGRRVSFSLVGARRVPARPSGNKARFDGISDNVDVEFEAGPRGLKETIVLHSRNAPAEFRFNLDLRGVTARVHGETGDIELVDATGAVTGRIPHAVVWDSAALGRVSADPAHAPVTFELVGSGSRPQLVVSVDRAWLDDPARVFPVYLDPVVQHAGVAGDTYISNCQTGPLGSDPFLAVGGGPEPGDPGCNRSALVKWNTGLQPGSLVLSASMHLYNATSYSCNLTETGMRRVRVDWDQATLWGQGIRYFTDGWPLATNSFTFRPGCPHQEAFGVKIGGEPDWVPFHDLNGSTAIRDTVREWVNDPGQNKGVLFEPTGDFWNNPYSFKRFASSEAGVVFGNGPVLKINWLPWIPVMRDVQVVSEPSFERGAKFRIRLENWGIETMRSDYPWNWWVTYVVRDCAGNSVWHEAKRTPIPRDIPAHGSDEFEVELNPLGPAAPGVPGCYKILFDLQNAPGTISMIWDGLSTQWFQLDVHDAPPEIRSAAPTGQTATNRPQLSAAARSADGYPWAWMSYQFRICKDEAMSRDCQVSPWQDESVDVRGATWQPTLDWETDYWWDVTAGEGRPESGGMQSRYGPLPLTPTVTQPRPQRFGADPQASDHGGVNLSIGNYSRAVTDLTVAGIGPALNVSRAYNSLDSTDHWFGQGWTTDWELSAKVEPDSGTVLVSFPDGRRQRFGQNPDGSYATSDGRPERLVGVAGGGFELTTEGGRRYVFDGAGRLATVSDGLGHDLELTYDGAGRLSVVRNKVNNRRLTYTWWGTTPDHVRSVRTDPVTDAVTGETSALEVTYTYEGSRLVSVCGPRSATECSRYGYTTVGAGLARLETIRLPKGNLFVKLGYRDDGSVAWQENGVGKRTTYDDNRASVEGLYHPIDGLRVLDGAAGPVPTGEPRELTVTGRAAGTPNEIPTDGVQSVVVNVSVDNPPKEMVARVYPHGGPVPDWNIVSNRSLPGRSTDQLAIIEVRQDGPGQPGKIDLRLDAEDGQSSSSTVTVDVIGWFGKAGVAGGSSYHPSAKPADESSVNPPMPTRLLSTVPGSQVGEHSTPFTAGSTRRVQVTGRAGVPAGATAAIVNLTAVNPTGAGSFTLYPTGAARPGVTNLRFGVARANQTMVKVGGDGAINLATDGANADLMIDVVGWFGPATMSTDGAVFRPATASRLAMTVDGWETGPFKEPWAGTDERYLPIAGKAPLDRPHVAAIAGTITSFLPSSVSHVAAYPAYTNFPGTTALLTRPNERTSNSLIGYQLSRDGQLAVRNGTGSADLEIDANGWFEYFDLDAKVVSPRGFESHFVYNPLGQLQRHVDEYGHVRSMTYTATGQLESVTDETGRSVSMAYDDHGNVVARTTQDGPEAPKRTTFHEYFFDEGNLRDPRNGKVLAERDPRSTPAADGRSSTDNRFRSTFEYNADGQLVTSRTPATPDFPQGRVNRFTFTTGTEPAVGGGTTPRGLPATTVDKAGRVARYEYFASGDLARTTLPSGARIELTHDQLGRATRSTEYSDAVPSGAQTDIGYDRAGRIVYQASPLTVEATGSFLFHRLERRVTYDANGNVTNVAASDATGLDATRTTTTSYDDADRVVDVVTPTGSVTHTEYDDDSNVARLCEGGTAADPCGGDARVHEIGYTRRGEQETITLKNFARDPIGAPTSVFDLLLEHRRYDPAGRLAEITNARGKTTAFTYVEDRLPAKKILKGFRNPDGTTTRDVVLEENRYDEAGNLVEALSGNGTRRATNVVDAAGRVVSTIADPGGRNQVTTREFLVDDQPKRVSVSEAGRTESVEYTYNAAGSVETATVAGLVTRYTYDQRGLRTSATSPGGRVTRYFYDWLGQLVREEAPQVTTEEHGKPSATVTPTTTIGYNTFGEVVARRDARGQTTRYTYDLDGRPLATVFPTYTTPAGNQITPTESQTYDNLGNVATATDRRGAVTTNVYDRRGKLVRRTDPVAVAGRDAGVSRYSYDDGGNLVSAINQIGAGAAFIYDDRDRQVGTWQLERYPAPGAGTAILQSTLAYDDASNVTSTKDPTGLTMQFTYDGLDVRRSMTDPSGARWTYDVDVANRPVATTDPEGRRTAATYDLAGRKVRTEVFDTAGTSLAHETYNVDPDGLVVSVTDRRGHTSMTDYDALGRVTRTQTPKGGGALITQSFAYDAAGNRTRKTDGRGNATWTTYTPWNLPEKVIEPPTAAHPAEADRTWTKVYDPAGAEVSSTAPGNVNRQAAYDGLGRLVSTTGSGAEAPTTTKTFDYDAASRVTSISRPGGTINVTYNDRDKPVQVSDTFTTGYTYDAAGRLLSRTDQAGVANFTYDNRGKLRTASDPLTGATGTYSYRPAGQLDNVSYGSGKVVDQFAYDAFGRVQSETVKNGASTLASFAYEYDPNGNVTAKTVGPATAAGAGRHTYSYDEANRLTSWTAPGGAVTTYSWDDASNRTGAGSSTFTYDERNRLTSSTDASVTTSYSWSPRGTLASKRVGTGTPVTTAFDAFDRTVSDGSTTYTYDGLDRIRTAGSRTMGWSGLSKELASDGTTTYSQDALGLPVAQKTGGTASLLVSDAHGDIVGTAAPNGTALASSRSFDPWGKRTATVGSAQPSRGFQGDWTDPDTGRVDMNARLYDPATGIFTARDSLDPPEMGNRYGYTDANPLSMTDSTGHWPDFVDRAVGWVNNNVVQPVWNGVKTAASWVNDHVIQPVWNGIKAVASWINDHIIQPIWNGVQTAWNWTKNQVKRVVNRVVNTTKRVVSNVVDAATARYRAMVQATTRAYNQARTFVHSVQKTMVAKATNMAQAIAQVAKPVVATVHAIHTRANEVFADVSKQIQLLPARVEDAVRATRDFVAEQVVPAARNFVEGAGQWISEHRATIAAVGVFAGCALITGGLGSAGCAAAAAGTYGALSGFDAHCTNGQSFGECAVGVVGYAAVGAAAGYLAPIAGGLVGGQGVASTLLAGAIGGGTFGGINSAGIQLIDNRRIDAGRLAGDTAIGAAAGAVGAGLGGAIGRLRSTPPATRAPGSAGGGGSARGAGRPDGATVISGHGSYGNKAVLRVPKGTSVRTYTLHGSSITDELGNAIETGTRGNRIAYSHKFGSGEVIPDYTVHPPTGLNIQGNPITVTRSTQLSEILKPGMGECHLAFCLWEPGHPLSDAYMGLLPP